MQRRRPGALSEAAVEPATDVLRSFPERFTNAYRAGMQPKLGFTEWVQGDDELVGELLRRMADHRADYTLTFRRLSELGDQPSGADGAVGELFDEPVAFDDWAARWRQRLEGESRSAGERRTGMRAVNPAFIPRNHRLEEVIRAATDDGDFTPFETLMNVLASPYEDQPEYAEYAAPPRPEEVVKETFCGT